MSATDDNYDKDRIIDEQKIAARNLERIARICAGLTGVRA